MPFVSLVFVLMSLFVVPASAEALNYRDYEVSVTVDGNNDVVTLSFPFQDWMDWGLSDYYRDEAVMGSGYIVSGEFEFLKSDRAYLLFAPFGNATFRDNIDAANIRYLSTDNIPSDASWNVSFRFFASEESSMWDNEFAFVRSWIVDGDSAFWYETDYTSSFDFIPDVYIPMWDDYHYAYDVHLSGVVNTSYDGWFPQFLIRFTTGSSIVYFELLTFDLTMSINSYYRVLEDMGYTEQIDELRQELEQQNIKLDSVINGTPEQNESANNAAGVLGDKGEQLGNLAGAIQPDKPNLDSVNTNVSDLVPSSGLNTLTTAISPIANNELVIKILVMVATLILVSYVLFGKRG